MSAPREVMIDGVRYVPVASAAADLEHIREAILDYFYGDSGLPRVPSRLGILIDDIPTCEANGMHDLTPLDAFLTEVAAALARRKT